MTAKLPQAVVDAHGRGLSLLPINAATKRPLVKWKHLQERPAPLAELEGWWDRWQPSRWAIVTGAVSGVVVLDFDGAEGSALCKELGLEPHVRTPSGGVHVYLRHPGHRVLTVSWTQQGKSATFLRENFPHLDVRGDGGYAVAIGEGYEWIELRFEPLPWSACP